MSIAWWYVGSESSGLRGYVGWEKIGGSVRFGSGELESEMIRMIREGKLHFTLSDDQVLCMFRNLPPPRSDRNRPSIHDGVERFSPLTTGGLFSFFIHGSMT